MTAAVSPLSRCTETGWDPAEIGDLLEDRFYNKIFKVAYIQTGRKLCQLVVYDVYSAKKLKLRRVLETLCGAFERRSRVLL